MAEKSGESQELRDRISRIELYLRVVMGVAVFFGVSGGLLVKNLLEATKNVKAVKTDADTLRQGISAAKQELSDVDRDLAGRLQQSIVEYLSTYGSSLAGVRFFSVRVRLYTDHPDDSLNVVQIRVPQLFSNLPSEKDVPPQRVQLQLPTGAKVIGAWWGPDFDKTHSNSFFIGLQTEGDTSLILRAASYGGFSDGFIWIYVIYSVPLARGQS